MKNARLKTALMLTIAALALASPSAHAADVWERLRAITTGMVSGKDFLIYGAFLLGIVAIIAGGMDMYKKSKGRGGDDIEWSGIGLKFVAGALLIGLTVTSDTMKETVLGTSATSASVNMN